MSDFITESLTIPAGETRVLPGGGYFRVHESDGALLVTFKTGDGMTLAQGTFEEGEWAQFPFGQVAVKNSTAAAITCKLRVSKYESGSDQMTGALTVTGEALAPVPVTAGIDLNRIGSTLGQNALAAGNQSSAVFVAEADSYALDRFEVVTDVPVAFGLTMTTEADVIAEGGTWSTMIQLGGLPWGSPSGVTPYTAFNIAPGVSTISDAAAGFVYFGTLQPGRHVIEPAPLFYFPAGHASAMGLTLKNIGAVSGNVTLIVSGMKV